jgi:polysaccharide pyruvyl transferase WcaK-like protein
MRHAKLYLNGGGSLMQDITSRRSLWYYLFTSAPPKSGGQSAHVRLRASAAPLRTGPEMTASILNRYVDAITLREPASQHFLARSASRSR